MCPRQHHSRRRLSKNNTLDGCGVGTYTSRMSKPVRDTFIKVRVTRDEREKYLDAAAYCDKPLGAVIRESLDRLAIYVEQERGK